MTSAGDKLYTAFGIVFRSELELPELLPAAPGSAAEVEIVRGAVPAELPGVLRQGARFQATADALRLQVDGVATFLIERGRRITVDAAADSEADAVRVFLLGSSLGALLHQRGDLVLHGSAMDWAGRAVVFLGRSGAGKSTLATAFRQRGRATLTDDLCVVRPDADGQLCAHPGFPQAKLWLDSLEELELPAEGLRRIRGKLEKRALPLAEDFRAAACPLRKLYVLRPANRPQLELSELSGPRKFDVLKNQTYRFHFLPAGEPQAQHFRRTIELAQRVPVALIVRPDGAFQLEALMAAIEADLRA